MCIRDSCTTPAEGRGLLEGAVSKALLAVAWEEDVAEERRGPAHTPPLPARVGGVAADPEEAERALLTAPV